jgi:hypothetical protein
LKLESMLDFIEQKTVHASCVLDKYQDVVSSFLDYAEAKTDRRRVEGMRGVLAQWMGERSLERREDRERAAAAHGALTFSSEERTGLASTFKFQCSCCDDPLKFESAKTMDVDGVKACHAMKETNVLAAYGAMQIGRGAGDAFQQMAFLDVPLDRSAWLKQYYRAEKLFGSKIKVVAEEIMKENIEMYKAACEVAIAEENPFYKMRSYNSQEYYSVVASDDACWDKRGSQHIYDSNHGTVTIWGHFPDGSARILFRFHYLITCTACESYRKRNGMPVNGVVPEGYKKGHDCKENHRDADNNPRSAKSMEAVGVAEACKKALEHGMMLTTLVMDEDSSVPAKVCAGDHCALEPGTEVEVVLIDPSHRLRVIGGKFYALADKKLAGEQPGDARFTKACAAEFKSYATDACYKARKHGKETGDWDAAEQQFKDHLRQACLGHAFNKHKEADMLGVDVEAEFLALGGMDYTLRGCDKLAQCYVCAALKDEEEDGPAWVPHLKHGLVGLRDGQKFRYLNSDGPSTALRAAIKKIVDEETADEKVKELIHLWDSQLNECGHNAYREKGPKARDYGHSASSQRRVDSAVGELERGPVIFHDLVLRRELGIEGAVRQPMLDAHGVKRKRKSMSQRHGLAKEARKKKRSTKRTRVSQAERVDEAAGYTYRHQMRAAGGGNAAPAGNGTLCEDCQDQPALFGEAGKRDSWRWCLSCSAAHTGCVRRRMRK